MYKLLNAATAKPVAWSVYTADTLWTEPHIASQMLAFHLNPDINAASRSFDFIEQSVDWLISSAGLNTSSSAIDFGCGPGLYTQRLKQRGVGTVVGVDFSENSIQYASRQAEISGLDIEYHLDDYLKYADSRQFDLISLVMCDFCALSPERRAVLLNKFKKLLKPNGIIALDVFTEVRFAKQSESVGLYKNHMNNFWSPHDYWCIQSGFGYEAERLWLDKFEIYEERKTWSVFNWLQHFTLGQLEAEIGQHGLKVTSTFDDLCGNPYTHNDEMAVLIMHQ